jgi:hypothetical protein
MKDLVTRDEKKYIEVARKYNLRLFTMKLWAFSLFDEGYSPAEVRYILRDLDFEGEHKTFSNTIRRYYSLWKKAQAPKARRK